MGVFCDRLKLCSTVAPDCRTGQNTGRYRKHELSFLLLLLGDIIFSINQLFYAINGLWGMFLSSNNLHKVGVQKQLWPWWNFDQIQWNEIFCTMYGLAVIEVMSLSGNLSNIDEIKWQTELDSFTKEGSKGNLRSSK